MNSLKSKVITFEMSITLILVVLGTNRIFNPKNDKYISPYCPSESLPQLIIIK